MLTLAHIVVCCFFFSLIGLGMECLFTGVLDARKGWRAGDRRLHGYSSPWYIPICSLAPLILHTWGWRILPLHWAFRGFAWMVMIYVIEFTWMWCIRQMVGSSPSEESYWRSGRSFYGLVRWDFAPAWFAGGLVLEAAFRFMHQACG